jgi:hypothetical protein
MIASVARQEGGPLGAFCAWTVFFILMFVIIRVVSLAMGMCTIDYMGGYIAVCNAGKDANDDDARQEESDQCIGSGNTRQARAGEVLLSGGQHAI